MYEPPMTFLKTKLALALGSGLAHVNSNGIHACVDVQLVLLTFSVLTLQGHLLRI